MPSFSGNKNQNSPLRTEGGVVFQRQMEFLEFQEEIWNSSSVTVTVCLVALVKHSE